MAKQRFRDVKQGRISSIPNKKNNYHNNKIQKATIANRIKAAITDSFMLVMPLMYIVFYLIFGGREGFAAHKLMGWIYILLPLIVIQIIFMSKSKQGQTPGMRAYNIILIDLKTHTKPVTGVIIYRQMLTLLSLFTFGWVTMFFRKDHRMLHELLSGTTLNQLPNESNKIENKSLV